MKGIRNSRGNKKNMKKMGPSLERRKQRLKLNERKFEEVLAFLCDLNKVKQREFFLLNKRNNIKRKFFSKGRKV